MRSTPAEGTFLMKQIVGPDPMVDYRHVGHELLGCMHHRLDSPSVRHFGQSLRET
jgi:hypothetical protein